MTDESPRPHTIVELTVDSFKRLHAAHLEPTPTGLVLVRGKNAAGKSSLIESMLDVLGAEKAELPITEGKHGGGVRIRLSNGDPSRDLIVEEKITRDSGGKAKRALSIVAADGAKVKGPAGVLKELRGRFADPVAFLEMKPEDQVKTVLGVLGLDEQLIDLELTAEGHYGRRRDLGRDADRIGKAAAELEAEVQGLSDPVSPGALRAAAEELQAARDHNAGLRAHQVTMDAAQAQGVEASQRLVRLREEIVKLEDEIAVQRETWVAAAAAVKGKLLIDSAPIVERIEAHESGAKAAGRRELALETRANATAAQTEHATAEAALLSTRQAIAELLGGVVFPIEGMAYDHETKALTIGGIPLSQASQAERLKVGAGVAMAGSPEIGVLFVREGSLLDDDSRIDLATLAESANFQLWFEKVDSNSDGAGVWIEDGEATQGE